MKVWFCRDSALNGGECSVWSGHKKKPEQDPDADGVWDLPLKQNKCLCDGTEETFKMFGKGFHGVKKGECKKLDLEKKC